MAWTQEQLAGVIEQNEAWLLSQAGVVGVGVGLDRDGNACVEVLTDDVSPDVRRSVEMRLNRVPLVFTNTGTIEAL